MNIEQKWTENNVLRAVIVVLIGMWLLGMATSTTMGGLVHFLLVIAIAVVVIRFLSESSPV